MHSDRVELAGVRDYDMQNYRFPRLVADLVPGFANSEFSNNTDPPKAITAETLVNIL